MTINYDHSQNLHTVNGPQAALPVLLAGQTITSLLDVGCGGGTWMKAAMEFGIPEVLGVEGVDIPLAQLHVPAEKFLRQDLTQPWDLGRRFDAIICLEVAEHVDSANAGLLIHTLVKHSDLILFSAACPGQAGQNHVNCQWPAYWQQLFNRQGYACSDAVRWRIWELEAVEPWYKQNIFAARRSPSEAGNEPRIRAVIHPEMMPLLDSKTAGDAFSTGVEKIKQGHMPMSWYLENTFNALRTKLKRKLKQNR